METIPLYEALGLQADLFSSETFILYFVSKTVFLITMRYNFFRKTEALSAITESAGSERMIFMLNIEKSREDTKLTIKLSGRLDTTTSPQLEKETQTSLNGVSELIFDMNDLEYVSSAGLRVLLAAQKIMNKQGKMAVCGVNEIIMEIFSVTGFSEVLSIEQ